MAVPLHRVLRAHHRELRVRHPELAGRPLPDVQVQPGPRGQDQLHVHLHDPGSPHHRGKYSDENGEIGLERLVEHLITPIFHSKTKW